MYPTPMIYSLFLFADKPVRAAPVFVLHKDSFTFSCYYYHDDEEEEVEDAVVVAMVQLFLHFRD